jgi:glycosidase
MDKVTAFWLKEVGVDGFRLDAAKHLIEEGSTQQNTDATHKWFTQFRPTYKEANPQAVTVGEFFGDTYKTLAEYTSGDQLDLAFNFNLAEGFISSANRGQAAYTVDALKYSLKAMPSAQFSPFITNHDQDRAMSQLYGEMEKAKIAAALLLTSPGVPFIYYGEEIGMVGKKPDENIRRPMQWSAEENAGFSGGRPWRQPDAGYVEVNVAAQADDPNSLLSLYRTLIQIRNEHPALRTGSITFPATGKSSVFSSLRVTDSETILVLINLSGEAINNYELDLRDISGNTLLPLMSVDADELPLSAKPVEELAPFSIHIFQIK